MKLHYDNVRNFYPNQGQVKITPSSCILQQAMDFSGVDIKTEPILDEDVFINSTVKSPNSDDEKSRDSDSPNSYRGYSPYSDDASLQYGDDNVHSPTEPIKSPSTVTEFLDLFDSLKDCDQYYKNDTNLSNSESNIDNDWWEKAFNLEDLNKESEVLEKSDINQFSSYNNNNIYNVNNNEDNLFNIFDI
ncbi:hypothetical protein LOTGIDRAFT_176927 [Lottia gigantea]|uniref:Uncharacterized protein n=1 Tax=Lottia gigantea TaxID=225164 RepID=V3ZWC2_LOTGI|nr:hypothetical protein LOTGIDRAFT_176927 [Lottia gigantea]ESO85256.1 hypothetical protein LOTGIDRAFT_176927 [Lottia gigantea]